MSAKLDKIEKLKEYFSNFSKYCEDIGYERVRDFIFDDLISGLKQLKSKHDLVVIRDGAAKDWMVSLVVFDLSEDVFETEFYGQDKDLDKACVKLVKELGKIGNDKGKARKSKN